MHSSYYEVGLDGASLRQERGVLAGYGVVGGGDVLPLDSDPFSPRHAMIVVVNPEDEPEPPAALLRRIYGLTRGEADTALMVLQGHGLKHIFEELSLSQATVKTHLQHVFDKTGTHRQAELVRLLLSLRSLCR